MPEVDNKAIGLCTDCTHRTEQVSSKGSIFIRCLLAESDPQFMKYPRLPVLQCDGYEPQADPAT